MGRPSFECSVLNFGWPFDADFRPWTEKRLHGVASMFEMVQKIPEKVIEFKNKYSKPVIKFCKTVFFELFLEQYWRPLHFFISGYRAGNKVYVWKKYFIFAWTSSRKRGLSVDVGEFILHLMQHLFGRANVYFTVFFNFDLRVGIVRERVFIVSVVESYIYILFVLFFLHCVFLFSKLMFDYFTCHPKW